MLKSTERMTHALLVFVGFVDWRNNIEYKCVLLAFIDTQSMSTLSKRKNAWQFPSSCQTNGSKMTNDCIIRIQKLSLQLFVMALFFTLSNLVPNHIAYSNKCDVSDVEWTKSLSRFAFCFYDVRLLINDWEIILLIMRILLVRTCRLNRGKSWRATD